MIDDILKKLPKAFQIEIIENLQKNLTQSEIYKAQKKYKKYYAKTASRGNEQILKLHPKIWRKFHMEQ